MNNLIWDLYVLFTYVISYVNQDEQCMVFL